MKRTGLTFVLILLVCVTIAAQPSQPRRQFIRPTSTCTYAVRDDGQELKLDIYDPAPDSQTTVDGKPKPTILYFFGGGFAGGSKSDGYFRGWFAQMTQAGYRVVAPDYRLGLKGTKGLRPGIIHKAYKAVYMAVEDAFAATEWLVEHADSLNIIPDNIVICGSSAGAVISLQCAYELSNGMKRSRVLPEGFRYAGVMSWSGAIVSKRGKPKYATAPPATLFFHGTSDKVVPFGQIKVGPWGFIGPEKIVKEFDKEGYTYHIYKHLDHGHEVAGIMSSTTQEQFRFLEDAVIRQLPDTIDRSVTSDWLKKRDESLLKIYR